MYYLYYGIWFGIRPRLSPKVVLFVELGALALVALVGLAFIICALSMLGEL